MTNIRRYPLNGSPVFVTAVTINRQPLLRSVQNKQLLLDIIRTVQEIHAFKMLGYVLMDDHIHLLLRPDHDELSKIMQSIKLRFARQCMFQRAWQPRFWDHIIRNQHDLNRHLDYIHYNPVKHGMVKAPSQYAFSSFNAYVERSVYEENWGAASVPLQIAGMNFE